MKTTDVSIEVPDSVLEAVVNQGKVDEPPHSFYKYPARFSPTFARAVIEAYTEKNDTVVDPFCGGGTSVVEAIAMGRRAAGFDISSLAVFLARAKTTPLSVHDKREITEWTKLVESLETPTSSKAEPLAEEEKHYRKNLPCEAKNFFETVVGLLDSLPKERQRKFARLVLLAVGQWALDLKTETRSWKVMSKQFCARMLQVLDDHYEFLGRAAAANELPRCRITETRRLMNRSCEESDQDGRVPKEWLPAKLVVTSPPYPGVHVLYHRWQVRGRRETAAPFWLAGCRDGAGATFYCLGNRGEQELRSYFERLGRAFSSICGLVNQDSLVVQLVAFSQPDWQLPAYLRKMEEAGFMEVRPVCGTECLFEGRIWRDVPGRKWYAKNMGKTASSQEVLLLHRKRAV